MMKSMRMVFCLCLLCLLAPSLASAADDGWQRRPFGDELTDATGAKVPVARLEGKLVGLYFSAHWCPPCRRFTPRLVDFRNQLGKESPLEIVFVSCDRDARAMADYMSGASMPWLAVPYASPRREALMERFHVRGIPALIILDKNGKTITPDGRRDVEANGVKALDAWRR